MTTVAASPRKAVHPVDEVLPAPKLAIYGLQHLLAFYAGAVIVAGLVTFFVAPYFGKLVASSRRSSRGRSSPSSVCRCCRSRLATQ